MRVDIRRYYAITSILCKHQINFNGYLNTNMKRKLKEYKFDLESEEDQPSKPLSYLSLSH